jgi:hypothetical protein
MAIACPACGNANSRDSESSCERCGCDLSRLRAVCEAATRHLALAAVCLRARDWPGAIRHAGQSWRLRHSESAARMAFFAAAAMGNTEAAGRWRDALRERQ